MAIWMLLAIAAQFLNAGVSLVDKYIVTSPKILPQPFVYAFYTCVLAGAAIVVYGFSAVPVPLDGVSFPSLYNVRFPTLEVMALAMFAAYTFFYALVSLFKALQEADASDVVPVVGAVSAVGSYALASLFLGTQLSSSFLLGVLLLALGTALVSRFHFSWTVALSSLHAGIFFALHFVVIKGLFNATSFDNGFFWSRAGLVLFALSLLLIPSYGGRIFAQTKVTGTRASVLILINKAVAGFASILILKATELGDVSVVQALGGLQYIFIFAFGAVLGPHTPIAYGETTRNPKVLLRKALFIGVITLGFSILFPG